MKANKRKTDAETRKTVAETEKLQLENLETLRRLALESGQNEHAIAQQLATHTSSGAIKKALQRLQDSPIQITSGKVEIISADQHGQKEKQ